MAFDKVVDSAILDAGLKQIADAIREKGGTSDSLAFPAAMAEAIAAIEAGGGGVTIPSNCFVASGSFVPTKEGTGETWPIQFASSFKKTAYGNAVVPMFALFRKDGFAASGGSSARYLNAYVGLCGDGSYGCGAATYRNSSASDLTGSGGVESSSTRSYAVPTAGASRTNCFVTNITYQSTDKPILTFGTFGVATLEAGKEYAWIAIVDGGFCEP